MPWFTDYRIGNYNFFSCHTPLEVLQKIIFKTKLFFVQIIVFDGKNTNSILCSDSYKQTSNGAYYFNYIRTPFSMAMWITVCTKTQKHKNTKTSALSPDLSGRVLFCFKP